MMPFLASGSPLGRRSLLKTLGGGLGMLGAAQVLAAEDSGGAPATELKTHFAPRAKRVIHLFMNGGPFQADLFDPKPALEKYSGQRPEGADLRTERPTGGCCHRPSSFSRRAKVVCRSANCSLNWPVISMISVSSARSIRITRITGPRSCR